MKSGFKIETFSTEVTNDYLRIYGGFSTVSAVLVPSLSGTIGSLPITTNATDKLLLYFHSNSENTNTGFLGFFN